MATTQTIPESPSKVFKIIPTTQQYDWGKRGRDAKVAVFAEASKLPGFAVDENAPYAEVSYIVTIDRPMLNRLSPAFLLALDGHSPHFPLESLRFRRPAIRTPRQALVIAHRRKRSEEVPRSEEGRATVPVQGLEHREGFEYSEPS